MSYSTHIILLTVFLLLLCFIQGTTQDSQESPSKIPISAPYQYCDSQGSSCVHKHIFPIDIIEFAGLIVLVIAVAAGNAAGVGGGGIIVPICITLFVFTPQQAITLSNVTIFLSSIARYIFVIQSKHPLDPVKPVIDYSSGMICLPTVLLGTFFGVFLKKVFPSMVLVVLLTIVLILLTIKIAAQFWRLHKQEDSYAKLKCILEEERKSAKKRRGKGKTPKVAAIEEFKRDSIPMADTETQDQNSKKSESVKSEYLSDIKVVSENTAEVDNPKKLGNAVSLKECSVTLPSMLMAKIKQPLLYKYMKRERSRFPLKKLIIVWIILIAYILTAIFRPSDKSSSIVGVEKCSIMDWGLICIFSVFCIAMTAVSIFILQRENKKKKEINFPFMKTDIVWNLKKLVLLSGKCSFGGLFAGLLGLGGGVIFNPLLLDAGHPPEVAAATGMYMVMYSSGAATVQYLITGDLNIEFSLWLGAFSIIGTITGMIWMKNYIKKTGRQSAILLMLAIMMLVSTIVMPIFGAISALKSNLRVWSFNSFCQ